MFFTVLEYISDNFFLLVYLYLFIHNLAESQAKDINDNWIITNSTLRSALYFFNLSIVIMFIFYLYYIIKTKFNVGSFDDMKAFAMGQLQPEPKDYSGSASAFNMSVLLIYGISGLGLGYVGYKFIRSLLNTKITINLDKYKIKK